MTGQVPDSWKQATVIPLKKCGNSTDVNNLHPISLLPIFFFFFFFFFFFIHFIYTVALPSTLRAGILVFHCDNHV